MACLFVTRTGDMRQTACAALTAPPRRRPLCRVQLAGSASYASARLISARRRTQGAESSPGVRIYLAVLHRAEMLVGASPCCVPRCQTASTWLAARS
jgi:hypothetical protein